MAGRRPAPRQLWKRACHQPAPPRQEPRARRSKRASGDRYQPVRWKRRRREQGGRALCREGVSTATGNEASLWGDPKEAPWLWPTARPGRSGGRLPTAAERARREGRVTPRRCGRASRTCRRQWSAPCGPGGAAPAREAGGEQVSTERTATRRAGHEARAAQRHPVPTPKPRPAPPTSRAAAAVTPGPCMPRLLHASIRTCSSSGDSASSASARPSSASTWAIRPGWKWPWRGSRGGAAGRNGGLGAVGLETGEATAREASASAGGPSAGGCPAQEPSPAQPSPAQPSPAQPSPVSRRPRAGPPPPCPAAPAGRRPTSAAPAGTASSGRTRAARTRGGRPRRPARRRRSCGRGGGGRGGGAARRHYGGRGGDAAPRGERRGEAGQGCRRERP
jgi:hypothetical protein